MQAIGVVQLVQVQQESLKIDLEDGSRAYDPSPLCQVPQILITAKGIIGILESGEEVIDVHHTNHPRSRYRGDNHVSIGFTSHYDAMRHRYGEHLVTGIAAESIIVQTDTRYTSENIGTRLAIRSQKDDTLMHLTAIIPALPCAPFSQFIANHKLSPAETKATLQYLSDGMRGFYMRLADESDSAIVQAGDVLLQV